ncbi:Fur family transcriptional regulator [Allonocardiopsis opalescens]|uniref:Fur family transcriptional regulator n=1 Tax=Allonocardiopsis opalescens TaxID=1144618 RepID=UPI001FEC4F3E|nr:transcriptional repressor [Allonocardiopsis opalescens]
MTRYDQAVLRVLDRASCFRSAQEVHALIADSAEPERRPSLSTVYRVLHQLAESGALDTVQSPAGERLYRMCGNDGRHHHLRCRRCGRVEEVPEREPLSRLVSSIGRETGYRSLHYSFELSGVCSGCDGAPGPRAAESRGATPRDQAAAPGAASTTSSTS